MSITVKDAAGATQKLATGAGDGNATPFVSPSAVALGAPADALATDSVSSWSIVALLKGLYALLAGTLVGRLLAATTGGATPYFIIAQNTINNTSLKGTAGQIYSIQVANFSTTLARYVKFYNKATAPDPTVDTPVKVICIPAAVAAQQPTVVVMSQAIGLAFAAGIGFVIVGGSANADTTPVTAGDVFLNIDYK